MLRNALDSYAILATAESQGRMEVEHALKFSEKLAGGTLLASSLDDSKVLCDSASLSTTLILGGSEPKPVVAVLFKVLGNGVLRYILYTCPNL